VESEHEDPKHAEQEPHEHEEVAGSNPPGISRGKIFLGLVVAAVVIFAAFFATRRISPNSAAILRTTSADITLVTADRTDLGCVSRQGIQGYYCGFSTEIINWQGDEQNKLAPYYTSRPFSIATSPNLPTSRASNSSASQPTAKSRSLASWPGCARTGRPRARGGILRTSKSERFRAARSKAEPARV